MAPPPIPSPRSTVLIFHFPSLSNAAHPLAQRITRRHSSVNGDPDSHTTYPLSINNKYYAAEVVLRCLGVPLVREKRARARAGAGSQVKPAGPGEGSRTADKQDESSEADWAESRADSGDEEEADTVLGDAEHSDNDSDNNDEFDEAELLEEALADVPAVIWLFDGLDSARPHSELLSVLVAHPPPIQLAVRAAAKPWSDAMADDVSEALLDIGFQMIDVTAASGDGWDEDALQEVRDALELHMWDGMRRHDARQGGGQPAIKQQREDGDSEAGGASEAKAEPLQSGRRPDTSSPSLDRSRGFVTASAKEEDGFVDFEAWLDLDEASGEGWDMPHEDLPAPRDDAASAYALKSANDHAPDGFDDAFRPFQSAPALAPVPAVPTTLRDIEAIPPSDATATATASHADAEGIPEIDPTALLQHLQAVRTQLAGVASEEERRARAAREVQTVFRGMGIDLDLAGAFDDPAYEEGTGKGGARAGTDMPHPGLDMADTGFEDGEDEVVRRVLGAERADLEPEEFETKAQRGKKEEEDLAQLMKALGM